MRKFLSQSLLLVLFVAGVAGIASGAGPQTGGWGMGGNPRSGGPSLAFFEAFPTNGAGTSGACSTTAPTGARGEALTFTRGSTAMCTKTASGGLATNGIANGDLVSVSSNVARVEYDSNGVLGLLVESSRTNSTVRSQELDNASWAKASLTVALPTVTADFAVAPDGTTTAERVQIPAIVAPQYSFITQAAACPASATVSYYVRGNGTSGSVNIWGGAAGSACFSCSYVAGSWTRCAGLANATAGLTMIGNDGTNCASPTTGAQDILVWGAQCEAGAYATSYIPTTTIAVTRSAEAASFALPVAMSASTGSHAVTASVAWTTNPTPGVVHFLRYDASAQPMYYVGGAANLRMWDGTTEPTILTTFVARMPTRIWSSYTGATQTLNNGTSSTTGAFDGTFGAGALSTLAVGVSGIDGIVTRACVDPDPTRCR